MTRECNCNTRSKVNGQCGYNGVCRHTVIVYDIECKITNKHYVGCTQQTLKERMTGHFINVKDLLKDGIKSDSYAKHFGHMLQYWGGNITHRIQRNSITCKVVWQGNPIAVAKTFGTRKCRLCAIEKLEILKRKRHKPETLINSCSEIHGACRHKPLFHRYVKTAPASTDDS